ncbi:aldehyde ferredoxin oxidoreductase family protein [Thermofilum pendens]|uniref:Aldehyde ferredoxin oxidoreductase n=1 Tax=Thermofilum pendens (strain DSM 2475 / Hrk 5) TaxID=368408 RepID=A1S182_THEPD|nr:aldehyde ferredoxin oxidoreductase family protein [Thermofilum pendens]ABL79212.1 Aldehyde ferredoxin oxidoreductase [Thermofilum pendens Hrk 5]
MSEPIPRKVLYIDLSSKRYWVEDRLDLFEEYLGGTGVATKLLEEELPRNVDPLGPENVIVFAVGPFNALYPTASKTVAMFKSPHTGNLGESHAGGRSAVAIRLAGYGAIVIKGASDLPVWVSVHGDKVYFRDARAIWGMTSSHTVGRILREVEPGSGVRTIMRIGRAGERMISYANVITETYRHFGRLGLGAVFGSKKLKALVVSGKGSVRVVDRKAYREVYDKIFKLIVDSPLMKKYHEIGTPINVRVLNALGALPSLNLQKASIDSADAISGEYIATNYLGRRVSCAHCPVACIHLAVVREPYEEEPYFYKTTFIGYDYEPIYALGSMLGAGEARDVLRLIDLVDSYGLDAMTTGVVLAWATEALSRGIISEKDLAGVKLRWGDYNAYMKAVQYIVEQPTELYRDLARGALYAARKWGGEDFALSFGGNEMAGYHTGPAAYANFAFGARHSHLDSAGYDLDQETIGRTPEPGELVRRLYEEESWRQVLTSLVVCLFARKVYKPEVVSEALKPLGIEMSVDDLYSLGRKIYREKYRLKLREGFRPEDVSFPRRIFETPTPHGLLSPEYMEKVKLEYVRLIREVTGEGASGHHDG